MYFGSLDAQHLLQTTLRVLRERLTNARKNIEVQRGCGDAVAQLFSGP
jgi:hypothetical protein